MPSPALTADVVVVGGGPGGTAAAIELARAGRDVTLVDKARFPRDKCCGDGLTTGVLRLLEHLGLAWESVPDWQIVDEVWVRSPSGRAVHLPLPQGLGQFAAVVPRVALDTAMVDLARSAGVKVHDGHSFTGFGPSVDDQVAVDVDGLGPIHARYVIAADGMWSPVRKALDVGDDGYLGEWHAFRQYFDHVTGTSAEQLWVWFEPDLLPGYAWSFPLPGGRANVGFGILRGGDLRVQDMKALWPELLARPHVAAALGSAAVPSAPHKAWPIPARGRPHGAGPRSDALRRRRREACDPLTGEGIGQALLTGTLAAAAILDAGARQPERAVEVYRRAVAREWTPDHRMAAALSRVLVHERLTRGAIKLADLNGWTRRNFARWLFEDEPRRPP